MNISLVKKPDKRNPKTLQMGLNSVSVFSSDESDDNSNKKEKEQSKQDRSARSIVNQDLIAEQTALRRRAQAAAVEGNEVYDYDGAFDKIQGDRQAAAEAHQTKNQDRSSRYVRDLLQAAGKRKRERDIIYDRKMTRQQAEEDAKADYRDKEKFVTAAYKKRLLEQELWQAKEAERERDEAANDVTKRTGGQAMTSFYGNMTRNVAMGGDPVLPRAGISRSQEEEKEHVQDFPPKKDNNLQKSNRSDEKTTLEKETVEDCRIRVRLARNKKVKEARERYFLRHGITANNT